MSDQENLDPLPVLPPKEPPTSGRRGDVSWKDYSNQWNDNHGTALMLFAGLILAIGSGLLYYQQNRFRPVTFPSGDVIESVKTELIDLELAELTDSPGQSASGGESGPTTASVTSNDRQSIVVRVVGNADAQGKIRLAIYRSPEHFNDSENADWKGEFSIGPDTTTNCEIPSSAVDGRFAIAVFHDANDNGKLDRNAIGIPTERYGFSNEARGKLGPPTFNEAIMDRPTFNGPIDLKIW